MVIIDNLPENFKLTKRNGIEIEAWMGNPQDEVLKPLEKALIDAVKDKPSDIRVNLKKLQQL